MIFASRGPSWCPLRAAAALLAGLTVVSTDGLIVVDKPGGMTSHDVVARIRRLARTRRVGHGGTLDPMATGVLVIGVGRATRLLTYVIGAGKSYTATIRLGQSTITDDAEGDVIATTPAGTVTDEAVRTALAALTGEIDQVPSAVSAIKINGERAYKRVREGESVELPARRVTISRLDVRSIRRDQTDVVDVDVDVTCSSGTYIRAIARDVGLALGVGGHLTALRRTAVGDFTLAEAATLDELEQRAPEVVNLPLDAAADRYFPRRDATPDEARILSHGGPLDPAGITGPYAVFGPDGLIAIVSERDGRARAEIVLAPA
ncbi:tRNA pseudouridine synthase B [Micromonospora kangleipakensis]|uniref:tRNA pseudouridine synthase B n=1 Tax=Micromonospora kangleipakensis TaxID=1077942 RepID=A0A4Q8B980_9ACTN|nr:tRNA pseudouridine(55) synthase TruB [Micromonospora kangleipakensis]RZU74048.1 tRNA pseudouridine synthase B [Micromonospora kangleipakensis]